MPAKKVMAKMVAATMPARPSVIVIDSPHFGSTPREGEVLEVIRGEIGVAIGSGGRTDIRA